MECDTQVIDCVDSILTVAVQDVGVAQWAPAPGDCHGQTLCRVEQHVSALLPFLKALEVLL